MLGTFYGKCFFQTWYEMYNGEMFRHASDSYNSQFNLNMICLSNFQWQVFYWQEIICIPESSLFRSLKYGTYKCVQPIFYTMCPTPITGATNLRSSRL